MGLKTLLSSDPDPARPQTDDNTFFSGIAKVVLCEFKVFILPYLMVINQFWKGVVFEWTS